MSRAGALALTACLALQLGLTIDALRGNAATFDEGAHLPAGYTYLVTGDHRLNPEQPPLAKVLAAAPLLLVAPEIRTTDVAWRSARQWEFGRRFLYRWNDADVLLFLGRLPIALLGSLLVLAVFLEARRRFGETAACAAAFLAACSPEVLAHGGLVTTDLPFALFFFLATTAFARLMEEVRPGRLLLAGLATGAAFATKFSAPILAAVLAALALIAVSRRQASSWRIGPARSLASRGKRLAAVAVVSLAIGALALAVVWAAYGFRREISREPSVRAAERAALETAGSRGWQRAVVAAADAGLVPEDYARGFLFVMEHSGGRSTFLLGELSDRGFPHYFLVTFLVKTPVPLLLLLALAVVRLRRPAWRDAVLLWLPVAVYAGLTFARSLQIGHRHLLPIYPFLFLAAGEALAACCACPRRRLGQVAAALLVAWSLGAVLHNHPHHLAYFNEPAGGPANGWRLLADSNLDWGQDLKRLRDWVRRHGAEGLKLSYFGSADPTFYGIEAQMLPGYTAPHPVRVTRQVAPGDLLAVSVTNLQGVYLDPADRPLMQKLRATEPIGRVGWSIRLYRVDFCWSAGASPP